MAAFPKSPIVYLVFENVDVEVGRQFVDLGLSPQVVRQRGHVERVQ